MDSILLHLVVLICIGVSGGEFTLKDGGDKLKIVGGVEEDYRPMIYLRADYGKGQWSSPCGATIINKDLILSAAHCCYHEPSKNVAIAGMHNTSHPSKNWQVRGVSQVQRHPNWNLSSQVYDLCVLRLNESLHLDKVDVSNFTREMVPEGTDLKIYGWGRVNFSGTEYSPILRGVSVTSVNFEECNKSYGGVLNEESMLCTSVPAKGPCNGDSGGPLVWDRPEGSFQVGIISFGHECALPDYPAVFAYVSRVIDWIHETIKWAEDNTIL